MSKVQITVDRVAGRTGAVVSGVRLSGDLDEEAVAAIRGALLAHKVVFFRDQHLDDSEHLAFTELLGEPVGHPTVPRPVETPYVGELDSTKGVRANNWHTDVTFVSNYPAFSILRGLVAPPYGGETVWANTVAAYQDLPPALQRLADDLWVVHSNAYDYVVQARHGDQDNELKQQFQKEVFASTVFETEHPLVRVHPETGERSLVLGGFAKSIVGLSAVDSAVLLELFQNHITRLENTVRWRWTAGDLAIWDNQATQHYAPDDYGDLPRIVRRITVAGEPPVSVGGRSSVILKGEDAPWYQETKVQVLA